MASRRFYQFTSSLVPYLTLLQGNFSIGATGAVSDVQGNGISNVVRLAAGTYQIKLQDNYYRFIDFHASFTQPVTGAALNISDGLTSGTAYQIVSLGTSTDANWQAIGLPSPMVAQVGQAFVATTSSPGTGTGTVKALASADVMAIELMGNPQVMVTSPTPPYGTPELIFRTMDATAADDTALVPADPAEGSVCYFHILLRNSSIKGLGET